MDENEDELIQDEAYKCRLPDFACYRRTGSFISANSSKIYLSIYICQFVKQRDTTVVDV